MVSVGISKLSLTDFIFVDLRGTINDGYYLDMLLSQQLLPVAEMRECATGQAIFNLSTRAADKANTARYVGQVVKTRSSATAEIARDA